MPELPEVETTTRGLKKTITGLAIKGVWTDLITQDRRKNDTVANPKYFAFFKKEVRNKKVLSVERQAKNILINISGGNTILIHLKMTGHLLFGKYKFSKRENKWLPDDPPKDGQGKSPLHDPFNRFVHVVFFFSNGKCLAFSDARKFGKITLLNTKNAHKSKHLSSLGPEPLEKNFTLEKFKKRLSAGGRRKIKTVLMDQSIIAGIGNIYSDEILWRIDVHPERRIAKIKDRELKLLLKAIKETLSQGIDLGGDSMSDYRNIHGLPGKFQLCHMAYGRAGEKCKKNGCKGIIKRKIINGRSAHFCGVHQILHA